MVFILIVKNRYGGEYVLAVQVNNYDQLQLVAQAQEGQALDWQETEPTGEIVYAASYNKPAGYYIIAMTPLEQP